MTTDHGPDLESQDIESIADYVVECASTSPLYGGPATTVVLRRLLSCLRDAQSAQRCRHIDFSLVRHRPASVKSDDENDPSLHIMRTDSGGISFTVVPNGRVSTAYAIQVNGSIWFECPAGPPQTRPLIDSLAKALAWRLDLMQSHTLSPVRMDTLVDSMFRPRSFNN